VGYALVWGSVTSPAVLRGFDTSFLCAAVASAMSDALVWNAGASPAVLCAFGTSIFSTPVAAAVDLALVRDTVTGFAAL
jgi:hypothetical protein